MNFLKLRAKQTIRLCDGDVVAGEVFEIPDGPNYRFLQRAGMAEAEPDYSGTACRRFFPDGPPSPQAAPAAPASDSQSAENRRRSPHDFLVTVL